MSASYIPSARDATIAYFGRNPHGFLRCYCVTCNDSSPLTDAHRVYGDLYVPTGPNGRAEDGQECDACGVQLLDLSRRCQADHDAQQREWARGPVTHVVEMGMVGSVRCRIY